MTKKYAFVLLGIESSCNHLFCSLFSSVKYNSNNICGTDMANLNEEGTYIYHEKEKFDKVWNNPSKKISDITTDSFVTSRSVPCGLNFPKTDMFIEKCISENYTPIIVILSRDINIVKKSSKNRHLPMNINEKIEYLNNIISKYKVKFISFETLMLFKNNYFSTWLKEIDINLEPPNENLYLKIHDSNKKYLVS